MFQVDNSVNKYVNTPFPPSHQKDRPGGVGTRDVYEDRRTEESGDRVGAEGLHRSRDLPDARGGGHLQGPSKARAAVPAESAFVSGHDRLIASRLVLLFRF